MTEYPPSGPAGSDPKVPPPSPQYGQQPPPYGGTAGYGVPGPPISDADRRMWAMLAHLGGIVLGIIAPLIVWAMYKDRDQFVKNQSVEALNFQITIAIAAVASVVLTIVIVGFFTLLAAIVANIVFSVLGGMTANRGEPYRYPFALRLVK